jgi:hypothetical protein
MMGLRLTTAPSHAVDLSVAPVPQPIQAPLQASTAFDWISRLLSPKAPGAGIPEAITLALFCAVLAVCIPRHETWFDEAQAWLIARDASLSDLFIHRLHYEGSPGLWHLLLWLEIRLHVSLLGMHFVSGALAACGVAVWLRFNPLPRVVSLLVPFGFFLQYQYAVVARSYILSPLFAFILMALYANRRSKPMWFCIVAGLLANCSLHMAALSAGIALLYFRDRLRLMKSGARPALLSSAVILALFFAAAVATAMPTADGSSTTANPIVSALRRASSSSNNSPVAKAAAVSQELTIVNVEPPQANRLADVLWHSVHTNPNASSKRRLAAACAKHLLVLLTAITVSVSTSNVLALLFLGLLVMVAWQLNAMWSLVPYVLVQLCNLLISGEAHHLGLLWIAILCSLWVIATKDVPRNDLIWQSRALLFAMTAVVAFLQVGWTYHAVTQDIALPYASSKAAANFIAHLPPGTRVAAFDDDSVTVNAYLPQRPYFNQHSDYWPFSRTQDADIYLRQTMATRPDVVMLKMASPVSPVMDQWVRLTPAGTELTQPVLEVVRAAGYRETARFCGQRFFRNTAESTDCRLVYEPIAPRSSSPSPSPVGSEKPSL